MGSFPTTSDAIGANPRQRFVVLWVISAAVVLLLTVPGLWWGYAVLFVGTSVILLATLLAVLQGHGDGIVTGWLLVYPLGYYFLSYPREKSIFTLDRAFIAILLVTICFAARLKDLPRLPEMRKAVVFWLLFLLV